MAEKLLNFHSFKIISPLQRGSTNAGGMEAVSTANFEAALKPLQDQQRQLNERMAKMQHTLDVMSYQQKERDSNSNINRDMVMLVVLVVMIQVSTSDDW